MNISAPTTPASRWDRVARSWIFEFRWLLAGIFLLGVLLRLSAYWVRRSLWWDEASFALNFFDTTPAKLLNPLEHLQAAPAGFNLLTLLVVKIAGISEWSLRFLPLVFGLASIFVFWRLSRRWLSGGPLLFANYTFAISPRLIYYSNEFKPYGLDVLAAMVMFLGAVAWWEDGRPRSYLPALAITGCLAVWLSFPVVLVMAGVGGVVLVACLSEKKYSALRDFIAVVVAWVISFGCQYFLFARRVMQANGADMADGWHRKDAFMPFPPWTHPGWFVTNFFNYFHDVAGFYHSFKILHLIFICGIIELVRRKATLRLCALLSPFAATLFVSAFTLYPFQARMILFTVPFALLICGEGVAGLFTYIRQPLLRAAVVAIALLLPSISSLSEFWKPKKVEEVRPIAEYLQREAGAQDVVLAIEMDPSNYDTTLTYYARVLDLKQTILPLRDEDDTSIQQRIAQELQQGHRCWLLMTFGPGSHEGSAFAHLQSHYRLRTVDQQVGAQLLAVEPL